jgi:uncharacterized membrane protein YvlD (DUF360 family)
MSIVLIKLAARLVAFTLVFWFATRKNPKVKIEPRWAIPLVAGLFGLFNIGLYWLCKPILNIATLGSIAFILPFFLNAVFLFLTTRAVEKKKWLQIDGLVATGWMALVLTIAHGALWLGLDYLPAHL